MNIRISRSFSKKLQIRPYEPIEFECAAELECKVLNGEEAMKLFPEYSKYLDSLVQGEVGISAAKFTMIDKKKSRDVSKDSAEHDTIQEIEIDKI